MVVTLRKVNTQDLEFLYQLLQERDPRANISHRKMPSFKEHCDFVDSRPYSAWYIIMAENESVGSVYLSKQDEIGIFLKKENKGKGYGSAALQILMMENPRNRYLANVSPKNNESINFFSKNNFDLIQYTFEFVNNNLRL